MAGKSGPVVPVEALRSAVLKASEESSLRQVAFEVGMSVSGLHSFVGGGRPYSSTVSKLIRWFHGQLDRTEGATSRKDADRALRLLTAHLKRPAAGRRAILKAITAITAKEKTAAPQWLTGDDR